MYKYSTVKAVQVLNDEDLDNIEATIEMEAHDEDERVTVTAHWTSENAQVVGLYASNESIREAFSEMGFDDELGSPEGTIDSYLWPEEEPDFPITDSEYAIAYIETLREMARVLQLYGNAEAGIARKNISDLLEATADWRREECMKG